LRRSRSVHAIAAVPSGPIAIETVSMAGGFPDGRAAKRSRRR
jgi:hypothetical protein